MIEIFLFLGVISLILIYRSLRPRVKNFPPGPWGVPILGNLPGLGFSPQKTLVKWKHTYGPIIGGYFGTQRTVFLNDNKIIRDAFSQNAFSGRPRLSLFLERSGGIPKGIVVSDGQEWMEQRRFVMRHLRDFGYGKKSLETIIQYEIAELIEILKAENQPGKPFSMTSDFNAAVVNSLWNMTLGYRFERNDPEFQRVIDLVNSTVKDNNLISNISVLVPWLSKYFPNLSGYNKLVKNMKPMSDYFRELVHKQLEQCDRSDFYPTCLMDLFIQEIKKTEDKNSSFYKENGLESATFVLMDIFIAGTETTSTTLNWLFLYMASFPEKQNKLIQELDQVLGAHKTPSLSDKDNLPYTQAVISETLRFATILPFSVLHNTLEDVEFYGYNIPKDTIVIPNIYESHFNPKTWGDPENFRPERFIDENGKFVKNDSLIPFSTGKRVCLGETLARDELFLFSARLFQTFSVYCDPKEPSPSLEGDFNQIVFPKPYKLYLKERNVW